ncbi:MAG TPA: glycosyltransferase family A protein [Chthonomonadaceae bacterium]|nr:glycosyltransferase family A protein [Chthonomonadaceae bacterium]
MQFSVLIATRNRPDDLIPCLRTVLALEHENYEVVVLDQSTSEATERAVRQAFGTSERLRLIRSNTTGKSLALNLLIEAACGQILAFTDDDTEVPSDWLTRIEAAFCANPEADILFGQVFVPEEATQIPGAHVPSLFFKEKRYLKPGEIAGMGANMAMRREVPARVGRFDTLLGPGTDLYAAEEGDFIYRAQAAGARILMEPSVTLIHRAWRGLEEWNHVLYCYGTGDAAFALKHVRCRDWRMLRPLIGRAGYIFARLCYRLLCRHPHQEEHYLRGYWNGVRLSLRYAVDPRTRLYVQAR